MYTRNEHLDRIDSFPGKPVIKVITGSKSLGWLVGLMAWLAAASFGQASELTCTNISIPTSDTNTLAADLWFAPPEPAAKPVILILRKE